MERNIHVLVVVWMSTICLCKSALITKHENVVEVKFKQSPNQRVFERGTRVTNGGSSVPALSPGQWELIRSNDEYILGQWFNKAKEKDPPKHQGKLQQNAHGNKHEAKHMKDRANHKTVVNDDKESVERQRNRHKETFLAEAKIIGGTYTLPDEWPFLASIQYLGEDLYWHHFCAGSLVDELWVVSAAHCVLSLENYTIRVVLGDYQLSLPYVDEQTINPALILRHAYYDNSSFYYDIAMVKLARAAVTSNAVQTIAVTTPSTDTFARGDKCFILGWGNEIGSAGEVTVSDYLRQSRMTILTVDECRLLYGDDIVVSQICINSGSASACSGDSGGPFVCQTDNKDWNLVGVASWIGSQTCDPGDPNVYTRISSFYTWINDVMDQH